MTMAFHTANYDTYVALGDPEMPPLWSWKVWRRFLPAIDPVVQAARGKSAVRCTQHLSNQAGIVKFGRLGWKEADHQKWSHGSPTNVKESKSWSFLNLEVWAPAWTECEREDRAPDAFLSILNESLSGGYGQNLLFNPVVVFAIASEVAQREASLVLPVVLTLQKLMSPKLFCYCRRPWGTTVKGGGFTDSIQDLAANGLFKPGPRHKGDVGLHLLDGKWTPVST